MATLTYDRIAAVRPANTNEADLYTVPASTELIKGVLFICNQDSSARTYQVALADGGNPAGNEDWVAYDTDIQPNITHKITGITLGAADVLIVQASVADKLSFVLSGLLKDSS